MKPKKNKKLSLNKKSISNLEQIDMKAVKTGFKTTIIIGTIDEYTCQCPTIMLNSICGTCGC